MKIKRSQLLMILLATGFFVGIIYTNIIKVESKVFNNIVFECVKNYEINYKKYLFLIVQERLGMLLFVIFFGQIYWKHIYAGLLILIAGIMAGSVLIMSISEMGLKGLFLCVVGMLPHMIFYVLGYWILICYWMDYKVGRWRVNKTLGIIIFISFGIFCEVYMNPLLLKMLL